MSIWVLIVDDDVKVRNTIKRKLRAVGDVAVAEAGNVPEAIQALSHEPDLVLLDLQLETAKADRSGITLLKHMRAQGSRSFFAVVSCHDDSKTVQAVLNAGADAFVPKDELSIPRLRSLVDSAAAATQKAPMMEDVLRFVETFHGGPSAALQAIQQQLVEAMVARERGDTSAAARALGVHRRTIQRRLKGE